MERTPLFMTKAPTSVEEIESNPDLMAIKGIVDDYSPEGAHMCVCVCVCVCVFVRAFDPTLSRFAHQKRHHTASGTATTPLPRAGLPRKSAWVERGSGEWRGEVVELGGCNTIQSM